MNVFIYWLLRGTCFTSTGDIYQQEKRVYNFFFRSVLTLLFAGTALHLIRSAVEVPIHNERVFFFVSTQQWRVKNPDFKNISINIETKKNTTSLLCIRVYLTADCSTVTYYTLYLLYLYTVVWCNNSEQCLFIIL